MSFLEKAVKAITAPFVRGLPPMTPDVSPSIVRTFGNVVSQRATSGAIVDDRTAMKSSAVAACVRILAETIGQIPLVLYRRMPDGHGEPALDHPVYKLLMQKPNFWQTPIQFKSQLEAHVAVRGNGYAYIDRDRNGVPIQLLPILPNRVQTMIDDAGFLWYQFSFERPEATRRVPLRDILHIKWLCWENYVALSPIMLQAERIGFALTSLEYSNRMYSNGVSLGLVLSHPGMLGEEGQKNLRMSLEENYRGSQNAFKALILEEGMKAEKLSMTAQEAQYLQSREFNDQAIAAIYGIPPHMINLTAKSTSWGSGLEQMTLGFLKYAMGPRFAHWIESCAQALLTDEERDEYYLDFDTDKFLRGDSAARFAKYSAARTIGVLTQNEIRNYENLPAMPGGDVLAAPLNSTASGPALGPDGMPLPPPEMPVPDAGDLVAAEMDR